MFNINQEFLFFGFFIIACLLRLSVFKIAGEPISSDSEYHEYLIKKIRENNNKLPLSEARVVGEFKSLTYPALYHKILSYLSDASIIFLKRYSAFIFDTLSVFALLITNIFFQISSNEIIWLLGAILIIHPSFSYSILAPRTFTLTPRNFSQFIFFIASVTYIIFYSSDNTAIKYTAYAAFILLNAVNIYASWFFIQFILFVGLASAIIWLDFNLIIACFFSLITSLILFRKRMFIQLSEQVKHLYWYYHRNRASIDNLTPPFQLLSKKHYFEFFKLTFGTILLRGNHFLGGLIKNPLILLILYFYFTNQVQTTAITTIVFSSFIVFTLTSFGPLKIFGESQRYLEYTLVLQLFILIAAPKSSLILPIYFYSLLLFLPAIYIQKEFNKKLYPEDSIKPVINIFKKNTQATVLCTSYHDFFYLLNQTQAKLVGMATPNFGTMIAKGKFFTDWFFDQYPHLSFTNFKAIYTEYRADHVIHNKRTEDYLKNKYAKSYDFSEFQLIYEDKNYSIYKLLKPIAS